jgi:hypothetical protein
LNYLLGFLSEPVTKFPYLFKEGAWLTDFLKEYPYLLPCFVASVISIAGWLLSLVFLEETLVKPSNDPSEETPLLQGASSPAEPADQQPKASFRKTLTSPILLISAVSALTAFEMLFYEGNVAQLSIYEYTPYFFFYLVLFPTWASTPIDKGGLGFKSDDIGIILSFGGFMMLFTQLVILHRLTEKFSMVRILQFSLFLALLDFFLVGLCRSFSHTWVWLGLLLCMAIQAMTRSICVTLGVILLNNVVVYANTLGFVNGFSQCKLLLFLFPKRVTIL